MKFNGRHWGLAVVILGTVLSLGLRPALGQANNPFIGTWVLDADKSVFVPGPAPASRTTTFAVADGGIKHSTKTGNNLIEYTAKFDGKDYPIEGTGLDTVVLKRVDDNTIERIGKVRGAQTETATMKVSSDGKTLTLTSKGAYQGTNYSSTQVYTRQ